MGDNDNDGDNDGDDNDDESDDDNDLSPCASISTSIGQRKKRTIIANSVQINSIPRIILV